MLGSNVTMGQNVTVWDEGCHETSGKNVTEWIFGQNPGKNGWLNCQSYIASTLGLGGRYINPRTFHLETIQWAPKV
jgi:hypothetical protein